MQKASVPVRLRSLLPKVAAVAAESYFVDVVDDMEESVLVPLLFLCFIFFLDIVDESEDMVFCAKTTVPERSERPRAAIMIFFILRYLLINNGMIARRAFNEYILTIDV